MERLRYKGASRVSRIAPFDRLQRDRRKHEKRGCRERGFDGSRGREKTRDVDSGFIGKRMEA